MADSASETITIDAPIDRVWSIATDIEGYPGWAHDVKEVVVRDRDDEGRPVEVEFRASALGRSTHYTLRYDYSSAPGRLEWSMATVTSSGRSTAPTPSNRSTTRAPR